MTDRKIIIDTDPGVDDAFALFLGHCYLQDEIIALTTTAGNVGIKQTTKNTLGLKKMMNANYKVYQGADKPLAIPFLDASDVHGISGMGEYSFNECDEITSSEYAWDAMYRLAKAHKKIDVIALGPLTNIAIALIKYPDFDQYINHVYSMGGSIGYGNTFPYSEFNYWCDPLAAKVVFNSPLSIKMIGLNATRQTMMNQQELDNIQGKSHQFVEFIHLQKQFYSQRLMEKNLSGFHLPDAVAVAAVIDPSMIKFIPAHVSIIAQPGLLQGYSIVNKKVGASQSTHEVAMHVDKNKYLQLMASINQL